MPRVFISTRRVSILLALLLLLGGRSEAQVTAPPEQLIPQSAAASPQITPDSAEKTKKSSTEPEVDFGPYVAKLQRKVRQNWHPPGPRNFKTTVSFKIHQDGQLSDVVLSEASSNKGYNQACLNAVRVSAPFDPLPKAFSREFIDVKFTFDFELSNPSHSAKPLSFWQKLFAP